MKKNRQNSKFYMILIAANLSVFLVTIIVSSASDNYVKQKIADSKRQSQTFDNRSADEVLRPGTVGDIDENKSLAVNQTPNIIANVSGIIKEIKNDRLILSGDGINFEDKIARDLNVVFNERTVTIVSVNPEIVRYDGLEGLKYLATGSNVLIEGSENLRGKTEFQVGTVKVLY